MNISDTERQKLNTILTSTDLYARAKQQVVESIDSKTFGSVRAWENVAIDLAIEKGVSMAFKELERLTKARPVAIGPVSARTIQKRSDLT